MPLDQIRQALATVSAIAITPFRADGQVDWDACSRVIKRMIHGGITVITCNGNTSEFYALSPRERLQEVKVTAEACDSRVIIVAGIGIDLSSAIELGSLSVQAGAQALMIYQPPHLYQSAKGWVEYHRAIADALPEAGIVPYIRDSAVSAAMLLELVDSCANVVGVKYAVPNPLQFAGIVNEVGVDRLCWICGLAESWAPFFWAGGAQGFTSGLANVYPEISLLLHRYLQAGQYHRAMAVWRSIKPFEDLRAQNNGANNVPVIKEALAQMGICTSVVRPPLSELPDADRARVADLLRNWSKAEC